MFYLFSKRPLTLPYFYSAKVDVKIKEVIQRKKFDVIYIYSSSMAQYVLDEKNTPKLMDFIDMDSDKWKQYSRFARFPAKIIYGLESNRLRMYEEKIAQSVDCCVVTSLEEAKKFKTSILGGMAWSKGNPLPKGQAGMAWWPKVEVVPNGVDFEYFKPGQGGYEKNCLIFSGRMDYFANVDGILYFYKEILQSIKAEIPDIRLYIVGANPPRKVQKLAQFDNIIVTGFVDDIRPYLEKSAVCVVPLRIACGVQNKILEAMSTGVPVVTTRQALLGIEAVPGRDILVEDDPKRFAQKTIELLKRKELRNMISQNARRLVEEKFNWNVNLRKLDKILEELSKVIR
jgi:sugar transferase (PEP-CTERM/EpsH1 system associated)